MADVDGVRIREKNEPVSVGFEILHDFPHRIVGRKDIVPGRDEVLRSQGAFEGVQRAGDEFFAGNRANFVGLVDGIEKVGDRRVRRSENGLLKTFEVKFEENVANDEK